MRTLIAAVLATTMITSTALAGDNAGPLAAGKPAGVKQAQLGTPAWVLLGLGVVTVVAVAVASSSNGSVPQPQNQLAVTTTTA
jgi:hypothetical protein